MLLGSDSNVIVNTAQLYLVNKNIDANELEAIKRYLLNPVDSRFKDILSGLRPQEFSSSDKEIPNLDFFENYTAEDFLLYKSEQGLAMEVDDLLFIQDYFKSIGRVPTETELKVLDTYWSDHCRHTTFETELKRLIFQLLSLKNNCRLLMINTWLCAMSWDVGKTADSHGYGDYFGRSKEPMAV